MLSPYLSEVSTFGLALCVFSTADPLKALKILAVLSRFGIGIHWSSGGSCLGFLEGTLVLHFSWFSVQKE